MSKAEIAVMERLMKEWDVYRKHFKVFFLPRIEDMFHSGRADELIAVIKKSLADNVDYVAERYGIDAVEYHKPRTVIIE